MNQAERRLAMDKAKTDLNTPSLLRGADGHGFILRSIARSLAVLADIAIDEADMVADFNTRIDQDEADH